MWQLLAAIAAFGILVVAIKVALIFMIIAGLIVRPKETFGILIVLGGLKAFSVHPWVTAVTLAALISAGYYYRRKEDREREVPSMSLPGPDE
ncbi:MAG: hypothetical protein EOP17_01240 [Rhizobiaceae bacterium]|nr:MAG: hypothetical protein EOP17_01240 [Rhizobiaceae bacterium]